MRALSARSDDRMLAVASVLLPHLEDKAHRASRPTTPSRKCSGIWRGLHAASTPPNDAFFLVSGPFGRNAGMWPS